jgi:hypothetical protein
MLAGFFVLCSWGAAAAHADDHTGAVGGLLSGAGQVVSSTTGTVQQGLDDTVGVATTVPGGLTTGGGGSTASHLRTTVRHAVTNVRTVVGDVGTVTAPVTTTVTDTVDRTVGTVLPPTQSQPSPQQPPSPSQQPPSPGGSQVAPSPVHPSPAVTAKRHSDRAAAPHRPARTRVARNLEPLGAPRPDHVPVVQATGVDPVATATADGLAVAAPARHHSQPSAPAGPGPFAPLSQLPAAPSLLLSGASGPLGLLVPSLGLALAASTVVRRTRRSLLVPVGPAFRPAFSPD